MTDKEKLDALLNAVIYLVEQTGGVTASFLRRGLEENGLIEYSMDYSDPGQWKIKKLV